MTDLLPPPVVRLIVCGNADRGDDGVAVAAAATLLPILPEEIARRLDVRRCSALRVDDLLETPTAMALVIIDAVVGPPPGEVVRIPLAKLAEREAFTPRSSHELPMDLVIGLAGVLRDGPVQGVFVGLAGHRFGFGTPLSRAARAGLPAFRDAIRSEIERLADGPIEDAARTAPIRDSRAET